MEIFTPTTLTIDLPARPPPAWKSLFRTFPLSASLSLSIFYHSQTAPVSSSCTRDNTCFIHFFFFHFKVKYFWPAVPSEMYSLPPPSGRLQHIFIEVQPHQPLPLLRTRQSKVHDFIYTVINGPVKLLGLVTGQDQHEPAGGRGTRLVSTKRNPTIKKMLIMSKRWVLTCCSVLQCGTRRRSGWLWGLRWSSPKRQRPPPQQLAFKKAARLRVWSPNAQAYSGSLPEECISLVNEEQKPVTQ